MAVYNFTVEDWHTYFVGEQRVLVHNTNGCPIKRNYKKPFNRPPSKKVSVNMNEVISGHTSKGNRARQSMQKDLFPDNMTSEEIEKEILRAYSNAEQVRRTRYNGEEAKILLQGVGKYNIIEMWYNKTTRIIETAYPIYGKKVKI